MTTAHAAFMKALIELRFAMDLAGVDPGGVIELNKPLRLRWFVPKLYGGEARKIPAWDSMQAHFRRRECDQDRRLFK